MWGHTKDKTFHPVCAESPSSTIRASSNPLFLLAPHNSIPHSTAWHIVHKIVAVTRFCLHVQRLSVVYTLYNICTYGLFLYIWNVVCLHFQTHMIAGVDFITNLIIVFTHNSRHRPTNYTSRWQPTTPTPSFSSCGSSSGKVHSQPLLEAFVNCHYYILPFVRDTCTTICMDAKCSGCGWMNLSLVLFMYSCTICAFPFDDIFSLISFCLRCHG